MNINPVNMQADIDHWLIGRDELEKRVAELGACITEDYRGKDVLMVDNALAIVDNIVSMKLGVQE